ncbi:CYTH domain-containing protein, partial [Vitellibacter sp. q18]|nr:CYTH domain-containing protein [Aequorivita lutea]
RRASLVPVFQTRFERRTWRIDLSKKVALWVMIDSGAVISGDKEMPISEVELELAQGDPADLLDFAIALASELPLIPDNRSKAERGFQLFLNEAVVPQKAGRSPLQDAMTTYDGFLALAQQGHAAWQANLLGS